MQFSPKFNSFIQLTFEAKVSLFPPQVDRRAVNLSAPTETGPFTTSGTRCLEVTLSLEVSRWSKM